MHSETWYCNWLWTIRVNYLNTLLTNKKMINSLSFFSQNKSLKRTSKYKSYYLLFHIFLEDILHFAAKKWLLTTKITSINLFINVTLLGGFLYRGFVTWILLMSHGLSRVIKNIWGLKRHALKQLKKVKQSVNTSELKTWIITDCLIWISTLDTFCFVNWW